MKRARHARYGEFLACLVLAVSAQVPAGPGFGRFEIVWQLPAEERVVVVAQRPRIPIRGRWGEADELL